MEGNAHLLPLIRKMRSQINRLERENRALRGELQGCGHRAEPAPGDGSGAARSLAGGGEGPAASPASSTSTASPASRASPASSASPTSPASPQGLALPAAAPREPTDTAMTVRRYPTISLAPAPPSTRAGRKPPSHGPLQVPGSAHSPAPPAAAQLSREEEKGLEKSPASCLYSHSSSMKLFQEHVYKCQGKVKAVSFLLPMDMSSFAEKQGSLRSPQN
ncbi:putative coiled-coil domain-containing protein 195 [Oenanthe melanoleuca]|uniref:putative coiled-coil domain-containing protein 195 n=1 Tax=Oenanthe melanoleuca TaxID=2939378 RepID=UPI0024C13377|nr:putative coiled-coil domain-containing protein 195 [Oenanthe melanoleuca]